MKIHGNTTITSPMINKIIELKNQGYSSRRIGNLLSISKTSVNNKFNEKGVVFKRKVTSNVRKLFIDVETSPDVAVTFKRFNANFSQDSIIEDGGMMLSIAWAWEDDETTRGLVLTPQEAVNRDDSRLSSVLHGLIECSDVIVGHNIKNFDLKVIKARNVINNLSPIKKVHIIDTLQMARQMKFQSNRLGSIGVILGEGDKLQHSGISTWIGCMAGNQDSLNEMLEYNLEDVNLLKRVYNRLKAHSNRTSNAGLFTDTESCPVCGSENVYETGGHVHTPAQTYLEVACRDCGARSRNTKPVGNKLKYVN